MKVRLEFAAITMGVGTVPIGFDAIELVTDTAEPIALPALPNRASYVLSATAVEGDVTVQVRGANSETPFDPARGRLITEANAASFHVLAGSRLAVHAYA